MEVKPFGLLTKDKQNELKNVGFENVEYFDGVRWCQKECPGFNGQLCYRIKKKVMSESECITYLENSDCKPADWPVEAQELALKIQEAYKSSDDKPFEYARSNGCWFSTGRVQRYDDDWSDYEHRLKRGVWPIKVKMTESECIAYLENSTTPPASWPAEVIVYAKKIKSGWEYLKNGKWLETDSITYGCDLLCDITVHRLKSARILPITIDDDGFRVVNIGSRQTMLNSMISHLKFKGFLDEQNRPCSFDDATYVELNK